MALDGFLKQSTAVTVKIGPFVDSTDGDTEETALTISQADVRLSKNGGNMAQKNEASSCTHDELGLYDCPLDATDTNTLGILTLAVHEAGALIVKHSYMVVTANVWDSMFGADVLQVDLTQINGVAQTATLDDIEAQTDDIGAAGAGLTAITDRLPAALVGGRIDASVGAVAAGAITAAAIATGAIDADALATDAVNEIVDQVWDEAILGHLASGSMGEALDLADVPSLAQITNAVFTTQLTESYNADGSAPTLAQALHVIMQRLTDFSISGTTITVRKLDGSTEAFTLALNDGANPTSSTRAT